MKKLLNLIGSILIMSGIIIFLGACGFLNKEYGEGSLMLKISQERFGAKTIEPSVDMEIEHYVISGTGPGGAQFEEVVVGVNDSPVEVGPLIVGVWTIGVEAWNDQDGNGLWNNAVDKWKGWGSTTVEIKVREQVEATVEVGPRTDEPGSLRIFLTWDINLLSGPTVTGTLTHLSGSPAYEIDLSVGDSITEDGGMYMAVYEETGLEPGYYSLLVYLNDGDLAVWGAFEAVRILAEWESSTGYELGPDDINPGGGISLGIDPDLQNPIIVTLEGVADIVPPVYQITVNVMTVPPDPDTYEYLWFVNGMYRGEVGGPEITIGAIGSGSDIELFEGNYRLDVGVIVDDTISSGTAFFVVSTGEAETCSISGQVTFETTSGVIGFEGVTMNLSGAAFATATTDEGGNYVFSGLTAGGNYTVSPDKPGYFFSADWSGTLAADVTDADFTATGPSYYISGNVWGDAYGKDVAMTIDTIPPLTVITNEWGFYTTASVPNGTYTLTPSLSGSNVAFYHHEKTLTVEGFNLTGENFNSAISYSVSGMVDYSGTKTGWVYINVTGESGWPTGVGTSILVTEFGSWPFTIRGVQPGTYTLTACMDNIGNGEPHGSNPSGSSAVFMVEDSDITGQTIDLTDPAAVTLEAPAIMAVFPANQSAWVVYDGPTDDNDMEIAQSYNVYWSTDPDLNKEKHEGMASFPPNWFGFYIATGLTDTSKCYFFMTAVADSHESDKSETFGPVAIGAAEGEYFISGEINFSQVATGPMFLAVYAETEEGLAASAMYIDSPLSPLPQWYSIGGVPEGDYLFLVIIDMNDNGVVDDGDYHIGFEGEFEVVVDGNVTQDYTFSPLPNASPQVTTSHWIDEWGEGYNLSFEVNGGSKMPVKASLMGGPNIPGIIDLSMFAWEDSSFGIHLGSTMPGVGDTYTFDITYSDSTTETLQALVTAVLDSFATPTSPIGDVVGADHPTFKWDAPDSPPLFYEYAINVWESMGGHIWWASEIPSSETSVEFNFNDEAEQEFLFYGTKYEWSIGIEDGNGNSASLGSVDFTPIAPAP